MIKRESHVEKVTIERPTAPLYTHIERVSEQTSQASRVRSSNVLYAKEIIPTYVRLRYPHNKRHIKIFEIIPIYTSEAMVGKNVFIR